LRSAQGQESLLENRNLLAVFQLDRILTDQLIRLMWLSRLTP